MQFALRVMGKFAVHNGAVGALVLVKHASVHDDHNTAVVTGDFAVLIEKDGNATILCPADARFTGLEGEFLSRVGPAHDFH